MESGPNTKQQQAFPWNEPCEPPEICNYIAHEGMTLRDYFAAKIVCGIMADNRVNLNSEDQYKLVAKHSWKMADAMLEAR
jgi:hypothetical protein